jgi:hypothetical protein
MLILISITSQTHVCTYTPTRIIKISCVSGVATRDKQNIYCFEIHINVKSAAKTSLLWHWKLILVLGEHIHLNINCHEWQWCVKRNNNIVLPKDGNNCILDLVALWMVPKSNTEFWLFFLLIWIKSHKLNKRRQQSSRTHSFAVSWKYTQRRPSNWLNCEEWSHCKTLLVQMAHSSLIENTILM